MNQPGPHPPPPLGATHNEPAPQRISVVDFDMPFGRMVIFMIKWAFAAIPALIIIWAVIFCVFFILAAFFGGMAAVLQHH